MRSFKPAPFPEQDAITDTLYTFTLGFFLSFLIYRSKLEN